MATSRLPPRVRFLIVGVVLAAGLLGARHWWHHGSIYGDYRSHGDLAITLTRPMHAVFAYKDDKGRCALFYGYVGQDRTRYPYNLDGFSCQSRAKIADWNAEMISDGTIRFRRDDGEVFDAIRADR